jgi:uncharacterized protein
LSTFLYDIGHGLDKTALKLWCHGSRFLFMIAMPMTADKDSLSGPAHYPGQPPVEAYGNGGFRFAGGSHTGSLLMLPGGVLAWNIADFSELETDAFAAALDQAADMDVFLLGCGPGMMIPPEKVSAAFARLDVTLEPMNTGAACRTYNLLLAEKRPVGAGLIAVK